MTSGKLRERVTFQRVTTGDDGYGNVVTGWADHLTVWASIRETTGKERVDAGRVEASATATLRIRASIAANGLTEADRVFAKSTVWNIISITDPDGRGRMLDVLIERGVAT